MTTYVISYDLHKPGRNYESLYEAIKGVSGDWAHINESVWAVKSTQHSSGKIRDILKAKMDNNDNLFVGKLTSEAAWFGLTEALTKWLKENL